MSYFLEKRVQQLKESRHKSIDGFERPPEADERLNELARRLLNSEDGEKLMNYLYSITVNTVLPASASDAELRMQEGMRRLVGIMDARRKSEPK